MSIKSEVMLVTPKLAESWLATKNNNNRPLNQRHSKRIAHAITDGEWVVNGDAIRFDDSGNLLDGQHRLHAITIANMPIESLVVTGLPSETFAHIDVGRAARTASHVVAIAGFSNYTILAASARLYYIWQRTGAPFVIKAEDAPSAATILNIVRDDDSFAEAAKTVASMRWVKRHISPSIAGFCFRVFLERDEKAARSFFRKLNDGLGIDAESPIYLLRERLMGLAENDKVAIKQDYKTALIFKAFRLYLDDARVKTLRVRTEGPARETNIFSV